MNIRRKVLTLYALTAAGVLFLLLAGAKVILLERLSLLEQDDVRLDMDRVLAATGGLLDAMQAVAKDYGNWDDTYAYMAAPYDAYIQANFVDATFQNLKLDMVLLAGSSGEVLYSQGYDLHEKQMRDVPPSWERLFREHGFFSGETMRADPDGRKGLVLTDEGPLMVVVKPVLTSDAQGPARGVIVMGRLLGDEAIKRLSQLTLLSLFWVEIENIRALIPEVEQGQPTPAAKAPTAVRPLSRSLAEGLSLVRDMKGEPIGAWRIELERSLHSKGVAGTVYFLSVMVAGGVVFAVLFAIIMERVVLGRLAGLSGQVESIAAHGDPSRRVASPGDDEIGELAVAINGMLEGLEKSSSELKAAAAELRAARDAAEQASQAKSRFLATMSHEIRTPLNALTGFTELACDKDAGDRLPEYLEDIRGASEHLRNLIEDILDFSKIEAGRLELESAPFNPGRLASETGALFDTLARAKGLAFELDVDDKAEAMVLGDSLRLRQVLSNLLDNALKFTGSGKVALRARVTPSGADRLAVLFEVEDTGVGISAESLSRIFDPFTQEDSSTTRRFGGTGLGLAICREIVALMGSELFAESTAGKGTRFVFEVEFPRSYARDFAPTGEEAPRDLSGARILVAEDNAFNRKIIKQMLEGAGAVVTLAENGTQAVLAALERDLDLVVMDMHMPEMDGLEATRVLKNHPCCQDVPILALTAGAMPGDRKRCLDAGMADYLAKPVSRRALLEAASRWIRREPSSGTGHPAPAAYPGLPGPVPAADLPPLEGVDLEQALAIYEGRTDLLARILRQFPSSFRGTCAEMAAMIGRGDVKQAWMAAHGLKGAAASIAATDAAALARSLETALSAGDIDAAQKLLAELEPVLLSLMDGIGKFLAALPGAQDTMEL
ncbi:MAG: CHASE4 domain-containing protein [Thermodesulfobacteriota bacterium]